MDPKDWADGRYRVSAFLQVVTIVAIIATWFGGSYEILKWERDASEERKGNHEHIVIALEEIKVLKIKQAILEDFLKRQYPVKFPQIP